MGKIFINSMPKSGTNLVSRLFDLSGFSYAKIGVAPTLIIGEQYLARQLLRRSFFERNPIIIGLDIQVPVRRSWLENKLGRVEDGCYITGHANCSAGLRELLHTSDMKTVLVIRDPRDVILSYAHYVADSTNHFLNSEYSRLSLSERIKFSLIGGRMAGYDVEGFPTMLARIDRWHGLNNVLVIKFEDLVGAKGGGSDEQQEDLLNRMGVFCETTFDVELVRDKLFGSSKTFRKGQIGSAEIELDQELLQMVDSELSPYREKWEYV